MILNITNINGSNSVRVLSPVSSQLTEGEPFLFGEPIMTSGIYKITHIDSKRVYIGSCANKRGVNTRINQHKHYLRGNAHQNIKLQRAWNKYGEKSFLFEIIEYCEPEKCLEREQFYIDTLAPYFNIAPTAGSNLGRIFPAEARKNMSLAHKGKKLSAEHREKISLSQIGRKHTEETRQKLHLAQLGNKKNLGNKRSEETKAKMSKSIKLAHLRKNNNGHYCRVIRLDSLNNTKIIYPSIKIAAQTIGIKPSGISAALNGSRKMAGGYKWERYLDN